MSAGNESDDDFSRNPLATDEASGPTGLFCLCGHPPKLPATPAGPRVDVPEPTLVGFSVRSEAVTTRGESRFASRPRSFAPAPGGRAMTTVYRL